MKSSLSDGIRKKAGALLIREGRTKTKLGEILGEGKTESPQQKFLRAKRFLDGDSEIKIETLLKLVRFFERPLSYFLDRESSEIFLTGLASSEKPENRNEKSLKDIEQALRRMGFAEHFIRQQVAQLRRK